MLRGGIIILLASLVGCSLINAVMLANFWRRKPRGELVVPEFLALFFSGIMGKDYMALLVEAHIEPTRFDKMLYMLNWIFVWSFIGGFALVIIGLIGKIMES